MATPTENEAATPKVKVLYQEPGNRPHLIRGTIEREGVHYKVTNETGTMTLHETLILSIKNVPEAKE